MPVELPYLASYKNVKTLFEKIRSARVPDVFTTGYLADTLGLKSSGDRALIALLKVLRFLDSAGRPTGTYSLLKHDKSAKAAIAEAIRTAYAPLFAANENAHQLLPDELKGLIGQVAGLDKTMTQRIMYTFRALCGAADFAATPSLQPDKELQQDKGKGDEIQEGPETAALRKGLRPDFHYNIQVHLPTNGSEETYINIFNAIRKVFK